MTPRVSGEPQRLDFMTPGVSGEPQRLDFMTPRVSSEPQRLSFMTPRVSSEPQRLNFMTPGVSGEPQRLDFMTPRVSSEPQRLDFMTPGVSSEPQRLSFMTPRVSGEPQRLSFMTPRVSGEPQRLDFMTPGVATVLRSCRRLLERLLSVGTANEYNGQKQPLRSPVRMAVKTLERPFRGTEVPVATLLRGNPRHPDASRGPEPVAGSGPKEVQSVTRRRRMASAIMPSPTSTALAGSGAW